MEAQEVERLEFGNKPQAISDEAGSKRVIVRIGNEKNLFECRNACDMHEKPPQENAARSRAKSERTPPCQLLAAQVCDKEQGRRNEKKVARLRSHGEPREHAGKRP